MTLTMPDADIALVALHVALHVALQVALQVTLLSDSDAAVTVLLPR